MITIPSILLINCVGSYLYSILNHLNTKDEINGTLYFLKQGSLKFSEPQMDDVKEKYRDNPWGYQPVKIENYVGNSLEIDSEFFRFLSDFYHLEIEEYNLEKYVLKELFRMVNNETSFLICTVDEFYWKNSKFYNNKHNKHFILIKNIDYDNEMVEIIDSEVNYSYLISFEEIEAAIRHSLYKQKIIYRVDGAKYNSDFSVQKQDIKEMRFDSEFIIDMIKDIRSKKNIREFEFSYYYKGYYYNIISKIIPYCYMCLQIYDTDLISFGMLKTILSEWKNISKNMYIRLYRQHVDADSLIAKLEKMNERYLNFNAYKDVK